MPKYRVIATNRSGHRYTKTGQAASEARVRASITRYYNKHPFDKFIDDVHGVKIQIKKVQSKRKLRRMA